MRDLVFNGFTREHAAAAVVESQGKGDEYARGLPNALAVEMLESERGQKKMSEDGMTTRDEKLALREGRLAVWDAYEDILGRAHPLTTTVEFSGGTDDDSWEVVFRGIVGFKVDIVFEDGSTWESVKVTGLRNPNIDDPDYMNEAGIAGLVEDPTQPDKTSRLFFPAENIRVIRYL